MSQRNLALILVTVGVVIYFMPIVQNLTNSAQHQLIGAVFAIGGLIIWYLPGTVHKKKKK